MEVVEIEVVRFQALETTFDGKRHVAPRSTRGLPLKSRHRPTKLRREDDLLAVTRHGLTENDLGGAAAIVVTAIKKRDALVERRLNHRLRLRRVAHRAEVVAAKPNRRNCQSGSTELTEFHSALTWTMTLPQC